MKTKIKKSDESNQLKRPAMSETGHGSEDNASTAGGSSRREFLQTIGLMGGGAAAAMMLNMSPGVARAADVAATHSSVSAPKYKIYDYSKIPQRTHKYPASDRAKKIVHKSMTMDTLFSGVWPSQWSDPSAPEFHDEMDRCKAAGFKVLAACP
jgi:membrane dipeptidase